LPDKLTFLNFAVSFGELDISPTTIVLLIGLSTFIFIAVGLSSFKLVQSLLKSDSNEGDQN